MIISLSKSENNLVLPPLKEIDVICFFFVPTAITGDESLWWEALCTSLRLKRGVLILESETTHFPEWDESRRLLAGDNWCWLSPRSLSVISEAYEKKPMTYSEFKTFLKISK